MLCSSPPQVTSHRDAHTISMGIGGTQHTIHGLYAMTRGQLLRSLWDAHAANATTTASRVERELLRRGQPRR